MEYQKKKAGIMKLIDTDIFIDFFRGVPEAATFLQEHVQDIIFSAITEAELLSGQVCNDVQEKEKVFHLLSQFEKIAVDNLLVQVAGDIRRKYGLEIPDAIIAASAFVSDSVLITRNINHFEKVKEIKVKKPY